MEELGKMAIVDCMCLRRRIIWWRVEEEESAVVIRLAGDFATLHQNIRSAGTLNRSPFDYRSSPVVLHPTGSWSIAKVGEKDRY